MDAYLNPLPELDMVLPGFPIRNVGMIVSPGGTGKSYLTLSIGAGLAGGIDVAGGIWGAPKEPGKVLLLAWEEDTEAIKQRLHQQMMLLSKVRGVPDERLKLIDNNFHIHSMKGDLSTLIDHHGEPGPLAFDLIEAGQQVDYRLCIVEPLARLHPCDENDNGKMTRLITTAEKICMEVNASMLFTHHTSKFATLNGKGDAQQASRGGSGLVDGSRWVVNLQTMTDDEASEYGNSVSEAHRRSWVRLATSKINNGPPQADKWVRRQGGVYGGVLCQDEPALHSVHSSKLCALTKKNTRNHGKATY